MKSSNEPETPSSSEPATDAVTPVAPARRGQWVTGLALSAAVASVALSATLWQRLGRLQEEMVRRATDVAQKVNESSNQVTQAEAVVQDVQARLGVAELRLSEVSLQRSQLEELMLSVSRSRDDTLVQDLESAVRLAWQQSQLTGSVQPLISALQAGDQRIQRAAQPRLNPVQRAMQRDVERIRGASVIDIPSLLGRMDQLIQQVDDWPLADAHPSAAAVMETPGRREGGAASATTTGHWWSTVQQWWQGQVTHWQAALRDGATELVRVRRLDQPEAVLLAPDQAFFLRENIKLMFLNVRMALLSRQFDEARVGVRRITEWLHRYFDAEANAPVFLALRQLQSDMKQEALPRPDETLAALAVAASGR